MDKVERKRLQKFLDPYRVTKGKGFRLADHDPGDTHGLGSEQKGQATEMLARGVDWLAEEQEKLYAQDRWGVLLVFQAMDAAGKDSTIKHVMSGVNPQGVQVTSFKAPSSRGARPRLPLALHEGAARAGPHRHLQPQLLRGGAGRPGAPGVPREAEAAAQAVTKDIWKERYEDIASVERYLARNGYLILKFFLHVSRDEQKKRFLERLDEPEKNWKFEPNDVRSARTGTPTWRPTRTRSAAPRQRTHRGTSCRPTTSGSRGWSSPAAIVDGMESLDLAYPAVDAAVRAEFAACRKWLIEEKP